MDVEDDHARPMVMGDDTAQYLHSLLNDSFKREIDADEAIWRSLPFFAAMIALVAAILPAIYGSALAVGSPGWRFVALSLLMLSFFSYCIAGYWFWTVIKLRRYRYPPPDTTLLEFAEQLGTYHASEPDVVLRDRKVRDDLRSFMLQSFAKATTNNARNNHAKAAGRSQVLLFVMAGFLMAFMAEGTILLSNVLTRIAKSGEHHVGRSFPSKR